MLNPSPFELRQGRFFSAYFSNIKELLFNPQDYFKKFKLFDSLGGAILFAYINHLLTFVFAGILQILLIGAVLYFGNASGEFSTQDILQDLPPDLPPFLVENFSKFLVASILVGYIALVLVMPLLQIAFTLLWACLHHLFLIVIGGSQKDFAHTFQVHLLFSFMAVVGLPFALLMIIPLLGILLAFAFGIFVLVYLVFYYIIGIAEVHQISVGRALISALAMAFICCCVAFLPIFLLPSFMRL